MSSKNPRDYWNLISQFFQRHNESVYTELTFFKKCSFLKTNKQKASNQLKPNSFTVVKSILNWQKQSTAGFLKGSCIACVTPNIFLYYSLVFFSDPLHLYLLTDLSTNKIH